jgi:hypothetical protein
MGCFGCGEPDPLTFGPTLMGTSRTCQSCNIDLTLQANPINKISIRNIAAIDQSYRNTLLSVVPNSTLLGQATDE